jgi:hypothetical protein
MKMHQQEFGEMDNWTADFLTGLTPWKTDFDMRSGPDIGTN